MPSSSVLPAGAITGKGLATDLNHQIQYIARSSNNSFGPNGNSWFITTVPYLSYGTVMEDDMSREVFMVESQSTTTRWLWDTDAEGYEGEYGTRRLLTITTDGYLVTQPSGGSWLFYGPDALAGLVGKLKQMTAPDGTETVATYDGGQQLTSLVRTLPGTQHNASLIYTSASSGPHAGRYIMVEKRISRDGVTQPVRRWFYTYHAGTDGTGNLNDLKTASEAIYNIQTSEWETLYTTYYRYYTEDSAEGFKYGLRFTLNPRDYARMVAAGYPPENPDVSPDSLLATFATSFRQYDPERRITLWQARGGTLTTTYDRLNSDGTGQNWSRRSIKTTADGSVQTVYYNEVNQPILKILTGTGVSTLEYSEYDENYHPVLRCGADAIASVTQPATSSDNLSVTLNTDQGLIKCWAYYPMSGGGADAAPGYVQWEGVQQGTSGTVIKINQFTYSSHTAGDTTLYRTASLTQYRSDADGGSNPATTSYEYEWRTDDSLRPLQKTITLPVVSIEEHGTGETYTQVERYDFFGNSEWLKDEIGVLVFQVFDPLSGGLWQRITDVDTLRMNPGVVPDGWITPPDGGFHLITDFECDAQGRNLQELGPLHSCDLDGAAKQVRTAVFRVYLDGRRQTWACQGYAVGDGYRTLGPVKIIQRNFNNQITDVIQSSNPGGNKIDGADRFPQSNWTKWNRNLYSDESLLLAKCAYHTIPSSDREVDDNPVLGFKNENYLETGYDYDVQDRWNKTVSPGGTITREVMDARNLVVEQWVGTDDVGATDTNPSGTGISSGNNMVKVLTNTYNNGQADNPGSLIEQRLPFSDTIGDEQVITYGYDFRGRRILSTANDGIRDLLQATTYDNQDNPVSVTNYQTSEIDANRTGYQTTAFNALNRIYIQQSYGVDQNTGVPTFPLKTDTWYDPRGLRIKTVRPGFNGYIKIHLDTLRRTIASYTAYPITGGLDGNNNDVVGDIVIEQSEFNYDESDNLVLNISRQRFIDATGTGPLQGPTGLQPLARVSYMSQWPDPIGRLHIQANYGTNGGSELERPILAPTPSDTILVRRTDYAQSGMPTQTVAPDGVITQTIQDCLGRNIVLIENFVANKPKDDGSSNRTTCFSYEPDGGLSRMIVKNNITGDQVTRWNYGTTLMESGVARSDLLIAKIYPGDVAPNGTTEQCVRYTYDRQGRTTATLDANGTTHVFNLDKLGRVLEDRIVALGTSIDGAVRRISRTFDARGLLESTTSHDNPTVGEGSVINQVVRRYDAFGQLVADIQSHSGVVNNETPKVDYSNADGSANTVRRTSITYPSGKVIEIGYGNEGDTDDRLSRIAQTQVVGEIDPLVTVQWAGVGRFLRMSMPKPQLELTYIKPLDEPVGDSGDPYSGYDRFGRTVDMRWNKTISTEAVQMVDRIQYGYDRGDHRLWRQDLAAPATALQDKFYSYDGLGQVIVAKQGTLNINRTAISAVPVNAEFFEYDSIGNWNSYQRDEEGVPTLQQFRQNNQDNQIVSLNGIAPGISYDANGNMTATPPNKSADWSQGFVMTWDAWNRLVQVNDAQSMSETARYSYDGTARRTTVTVSSITQHFFYNDVWKCVEERLGDSVIPENQYFWGMRPGHPDELLRRDTDDSIMYCLMDYFDPIAITDADGTVEERYSFSAFGIVQFLQYDFTPRTNSLFDWKFLFHGQFLDAETMWYNYGFRYYHPEIGRFLSRDPIEEKGGSNLYAMALNDCINSIDKLGLWNPLLGAIAAALQQFADEIIDDGCLDKCKEECYECVNAVGAIATVAILAAATDAQLACAALWVGGPWTALLAVACIAFVTATEVDALDDLRSMMWDKFAECDKKCPCPLP